MADWEGLFWVATISGALLIVPVGVVLRFGFGPVRTMAGLIRLDYELEDEIRRRVKARCGRVSIARLQRLPAEEALEHAACEEIVAVLNARYPERKFRVKRNWPRAGCTVLDGEAILTIWVGHDYQDDGNGIEPLKFPVDWRLRPDATRSIRKVLQRATQADPLPLNAKLKG